MLQRHTRYGVTADRFEAKVEMSYDGGASWKPGYHQLFVRVPVPRTDSGTRLQHRTRPQPYVPLTYHGRAGTSSTGHFVARTTPSATLPAMMS